MIIVNTVITMIHNHCLSLLGHYNWSSWNRRHYHPHWREAEKIVAPILKAPTTVRLIWFLCTIWHLHLQESWNTKLQKHCTFDWYCRNGGENGDKSKKYPRHGRQITRQHQIGDRTSFPLVSALNVDKFLFKERKCARGWLQSRLVD